MDSQLEKPQERAHWHLSKEVSISVILAVVLQTVTTVWWAATLNTKVDLVIQAQTEYRADRYTREDARRDLELMKQRDSDIERRLQRLEVGKL